jgi:hypothetical protein
VNCHYEKSRNIVYPDFSLHILESDYLAVKRRVGTIINPKACKLCGATAKVKETPVRLKARIKGKLKELWVTINTCIWCDDGLNRRKKK